MKPIAIAITAILTTIPCYAHSLNIPERMAEVKQEYTTVEQRTTSQEELVHKMRIRLIELNAIYQELEAMKDQLEEMKLDDMELEEGE